jgi:hypothetical protein
MDELWLLVVSIWAVEFNQHLTIWDRVRFQWTWKGWDGSGLPLKTQPNKKTRNFGTKMKSDAGATPCNRLFQPFHLTLQSEPPLLLGARWADLCRCASCIYEQNVCLFWKIISHPNCLLLFVKLSTEQTFAIIDPKILLQNPTEKVGGSWKWWTFSVNLWRCPVNSS